MRPQLDVNTNPEEFKDYYWLKEELLSFCKTNRLPGSGGKDELTARIYHYLKTGEKTAPSPARRTGRKMPDALPAPDGRIPENYKNDEKHRAFFAAQIGRHFKFNICFMDWMKKNPGKTYREAIAEWNRIHAEKKQGIKTGISAQFEYNQYTRDFYTANPGANRADAIKCWYYKKTLPGHNRYEESDLLALKS